MGLLDRLFGRNKDVAKELLVDETKKVKLWPKHVSDFAEINYLSKSFSFSTVDKALKDFPALEKTLGEIESLISPELVSIGKEEKLEDEILADLKLLKSRDEVHKLSGDLQFEAPRQAKLREVLNEIYNNWTVALQLIRLIRKKPVNVRELLLELYKIILKNSDLYSPFYAESHPEHKDIHTEIMRIAKAIIFNEEIIEKIEAAVDKDEVKFVSKMAGQMAPGDTPKRYRELAVSIFEKLAEMAGSPFPKEAKPYIAGLKKMERLMDDDSLMFTLVKGFRPRYDDAKIKLIVKAFREAYANTFFEDIASDL